MATSVHRWSEGLIGLIAFFLTDFFVEHQSRLFDVFLRLIIELIWIFRKIWYTAG